MDHFLLSVVVPMYYEQEVVQECHRRITKVLSTMPDYEIIYVNDGSRDQTLPLLKQIAAQDPRAHIISFSRNFGHQAAVSAGIAYAQGDAVVIIDADLQDPPELIPQMVERWQQGSDVVYAKRSHRDGESRFKLWTAAIFYRMLRTLTDTDIPADTGDFRLIDRKVADAFLQMPEHNRFIRGMVPWLGFTQTPIEYHREERFAGETKYPLKKMVKLASDGIMSFSTRPLQLVMGMGFVSIVVAVLIALYALITKFTGHASMPGWTSLIVLITFLGGIQLVSLGVVGAYVGRIYEETRNRPLYLIDETINMPSKRHQKD